MITVKTYVPSTHLLGSSSIIDYNGTQVCPIDDIGAFSPIWDHHTTLLDKVCKKLQDDGFIVNSLKYE